MKVYSTIFSILFTLGTSQAFSQTTVPALGTAHGNVVHNVTSTSSFSLDAGTWDNCKTNENASHISCDLNFSYIEVGDKHIDLTEGVYLPPFPDSEVFHHYYLSGSTFIGSAQNAPVMRVTISIFINSEGVKTGYISIPQTGTKEYLAIDNDTN